MFIDFTANYVMKPLPAGDYSIFCKNLSLLEPSLLNVDKFQQSSDHHSINHFMRYYYCHTFPIFFINTSKYISSETIHISY